MGFHLKICPLLFTLFCVVACASAPPENLDENSGDADSKRSETEILNQKKYKHYLDRFYQENTDALDLATLITQKNRFSSYFDLQGAILQTDAHKQNRYPQVRPVTSVNQDGDAVARLLIEQTLWDNGRYKAGKNVLLAGEERAVALYRIQANERIAQGIDASLQYQKYAQLIALTNESLKTYRRLNEMAIGRAQGGIGRRAEQDLFALKVLQIEAEKHDYTARLMQSEHAFFNFTGVSPASVLDDAKPLHIRIPDLSETDWELIPEMADSLAEGAEMQAEFKREKSERRPQLVLTGSAGDGTDLGLGADDQANNATIGFAYTQPLNWGSNSVLKALQQNVIASETRLSETKREIENQLSILQQRYDFLAQSLPEKLRIKALAEDRIFNFQQDFSAGTSTILEAVNILETAKSLSTQYTESVYELESLKLEQARTRGLLGPIEYLTYEPGDP